MARRLLEEELLCSTDAWLLADNLLMQPDPERFPIPPFDYRLLRILLSLLFRAKWLDQLRSSDISLIEQVEWHADGYGPLPACPEVPGQFQSMAGSFLEDLAHVCDLDPRHSALNWIAMASKRRKTHINAHAILHDLAGNPMRPCPDLTTNPTALAIASAAYEHHDLQGRLDQTTLSVLADALIDAGIPEDVSCRLCGGKWVASIGPDRVEMICYHCEGRGRVENPILAHLRHEKCHWRGCHVVDAVLGLRKR